MRLRATALTYSNKISCIKEIRAIFSCGLKEAKDYMDILTAVPYASQGWEDGVVVPGFVTDNPLDHNLKGSLYLETVEKKEFHNRY